VLTGKTLVGDLPYAMSDYPPTRRHAVVAQLRDAIVAGALEPGTLLREVALAKSLGVSATPVREAIGELASEGLVEVEAHRLKRVTPMDFKAIRDLILVQTELWRLGYIWGMPNIGPAEFAHLETALERYRAGLDAEEPLAAIRASHDFHTVVITASDNVELLRSTLDRRSLIARFILLQARATISRQGLAGHQRILQALRRRRPAEALEQLGRIAERLVSLTIEADPSATRPVREN
jgi:DNA-binding GntR family transcriptional regulator